MNSEIYEYAATNRLSAYILCSNIRYLVDFENMFLNKRARLRGGYDDPKFIDMLKPVKVFDDGRYYWKHLTLYEIEPWHDCGCRNMSWIAGHHAPITSCG